MKLNQTVVQAWCITSFSQLLWSPRQSCFYCWRSKVSSYFPKSATGHLRNKQLLPFCVALLMYYSVNNACWVCISLAVALFFQVRIFLSLLGCLASRTCVPPVEGYWWIFTSTGEHCEQSNQWQSSSQCKWIKVQEEASPTPLYPGMQHVFHWWAYIWVRAR